MKRVARYLLRGFLLVAVPLGVLVLAGLIYAAGGRYVTSENAYVKAAIINISPDVDGRVERVLVTDNQRIDAGQLLFEIDPAPFEIALAAGDADMAAVRQQIESLRAGYRQGELEIAAAGERAQYLILEYERQVKLETKGIGVRAKLEAAEHDLSMARRHVDTLRERNRMILADLGGNPAAPVESHPLYRQATARRDQAALALSHSSVIAPLAGFLSGVSLEAGEYVEAGDPVFALVASGSPWIEVNLKEIHLTHVAVGQSATVVVDAYPDRVWRARIDSISPATGAEFALLPPQNSTGNWVKVVQRVPLRLALEEEAGAPPLRAGMTVTVSIDTKRKRDVGKEIAKLIGVLVDRVEAFTISQP
ncbi:MAG: HlyD family secretion protein [Alphaproteobacteria bacterium]